MKQDKDSFTHGNALNLFLVYEFMIHGQEI